MPFKGFNLQKLLKLLNDTPTELSRGVELHGVRHYIQTLVSYRCSLGFTVYRLYCGILELFPYNALGHVCACTSSFSMQPKRLFNSLSHSGPLEEILAPLENQNLTDRGKALGDI